MAATTMINPRPTNLMSRNPEEGEGNHEKATPRKHRPTRIPASGVRNPIAKAAPAIIKTKPGGQLANGMLDGLERKKTPSAIAPTPSAARSSNNPMPGLPSGNVENNLCSAYLPLALSNGD